MPSNVFSAELKMFVTFIRILECAFQIAGDLSLSLTNINTEGGDDIFIHLLLTYSA